MFSSSPRSVIVKNRFDEGKKIINLRIEFYTYQESHTEYKHELFLLVKATIVLVSQVSKFPNYPLLHRGCEPECHVLLYGVLGCSPPEG